VLYPSENYKKMNIFYLNIMNKDLSFILIFFALLTLCSSTFKKVIHNTDPEAKCLDGTPGLIFVN
jgi:hypothetical protein